MILSSFLRYLVGAPLMSSIILCFLLISFILSFVRRKGFYCTYIGTSVFVKRYVCVNWVCPIRSRVNNIISNLLSFMVVHFSVFSMINLSLLLDVFRTLHFSVLYSVF